MSGLKNLAKWFFADGELSGVVPIRSRLKKAAASCRTPWGVCSRFSAANRVQRRESFLRIWILVAGGWFCASASVGGAEEFYEQQRFSSADAHQGVGVGPNLVYAVGSRSISAHDKLTGLPLRTWKADGVGEWIHLDSAVFKDGELFCSHSNFPLLPMSGSVEVYDAATLTWQRRHRFEEVPGSCTWVDWYDDAWWVCFAHYGGFGGYPDKDNSWTTLVKYDVDWTELQRWRFPAEVLKRFGRYSCSGGSWGPDGLLYTTGHDEAETYVLRVPENDQVLELVRVQPLSCLGQGIAWDRTPGHESKLYTIRRRDRLVVVQRLAVTE